MIFKVQVYFEWSIGECNVHFEWSNSSLPHWKRRPLFRKDDREARLE